MHNAKTKLMNSEAIAFETILHNGKNNYQSMKPLKAQLKLETEGGDITLGHFIFQ
jgi:hypothetical protein